MSRPLAGWLEGTLAIGPLLHGLVLLTPAMLPEEQWATGLNLLKSKDEFTVESRELLPPPFPGIGLDMDEDALARYRVKV